MASRITQELKQDWWKTIEGECCSHTAIWREKERMKQKKEETSRRSSSALPSVCWTTFTEWHGKLAATSSWTMPSFVQWMAISMCWQHCRPSRRPQWWGRMKPSTSSSSSVIGGKDNPSMSSWGRGSRTGQTSRICLMELRWRMTWRPTSCWSTSTFLEKIADRSCWPTTRCTPPQVSRRLWGSPSMMFMRGRSPTPRLAGKRIEEVWWEVQEGLCSPGWRWEHGGDPRWGLFPWRDLPWWGVLRGWGGLLWRRRDRSGERGPVGQWSIRRWRSVRGLCNNGQAEKDISGVSQEAQFAAVPRILQGRSFCRGEAEGSRRGEEEEPLWVPWPHWPLGWRCGLPEYNQGWSLSEGKWEERQEQEGRRPQRKRQGFLRVGWPHVLLVGKLWGAGRVLQHGSRRGWREKYGSRWWLDWAWRPKEEHQAVATSSNPSVLCFVSGVAVRMGTCGWAHPEDAVDQWGACDPAGGDCKWGHSSSSWSSVPAGWELWGS